MAIREFTSFEDFRAAAEAEEKRVFVPFGTSPKAGFVGFAFALDAFDEVVGHFSKEAGSLGITDGVLASTRREYLVYEG